MEADSAGIEGDHACRRGCPDPWLSPAGQESRGNGNFHCRECTPDPKRNTDANESARFVLGAIAVAMNSTSCSEAIVSARSRRDGFMVVRTRCVGLST